ncbi:MAG: hypothetical protein NC489_41950, partial [Ruminococcus flavefaciens]|nr:hypothetical protein [Ruminococcus flavefaciens]
MPDPSHADWKAGNIRSVMACRRKTEEGQKKDMSYDISLRERDTGEAVQFDAPHFMAGGTYALGGTQE